MGATWIGFEEMSKQNRQRCIAWDTVEQTQDRHVSERCRDEATEAFRDTDLWFCERHMKMATLPPESNDDKESSNTTT